MNRLRNEKLIFNKELLICNIELNIINCSYCYMYYRCMYEMQTKRMFLGLCLDPYGIRKVWKKL